MAHEARFALNEQRSRLDSASGRVGFLSSKLPAIGNIIFRIRGRRRRDAIIVGLVIFFLLFLLVLYKR